jgi:hypothetical protein
LEEKIERRRGWVQSFVRESLGQESQGIYLLFCSIPGSREIKRVLCVRVL